MRADSKAFSAAARRCRVLQGRPGFRHPQRSSRWPARLVVAALSALRATIARAKTLIAQPELRATLLGWAVGNWLFDAACLWVCLRAYGATVHPGALLVAYGAANLIGLLPLTPGGLGLVEGTLIPALTALSGADATAVVLGVLTWRAFEFWLPIPVSGISYLSLRPWRHRPPRLRPAHHAHRTGGVTQNLAADRPEQQTGESPSAPGPDHDERCLL